MSAWTRKRKHAHDGNRQAAKHGPSAKDQRAALAAQQREQANKEISQSLRDIYRKLASALHPDREPDVEQRVLKTRLMQRANDAYEANDLLALLELQLEIEQIDAAHITSVAPEKLAHYNQILREQLAGLQGEVAATVARLLNGLEGDLRRAPTPLLVDRQLASAAAELRIAVARLTQDLLVFRDPTQLRARLEQYDLAQDDDFESDAPFEMLDALVDVESSAPSRPSPGSVNGARTDTRGNAGKTAKKNTKRGKRRR